MSHEATTHYKTLLDDNGFLGPQHFPKPKTVTISRAVKELMPQRDGDKSEPQSIAVMYFKHEGKELKLKLKLPKVVMYGLEAEFGTALEDWADKEVTLYATKCLSFGAPEECVRIKFSPAAEAKIMKKLKKSKTNPQVYRIKE